MLAVHKALFSRNGYGALEIEMDDAAFVRADLVFIDPGSGQVSALLGELHFKIGTVDRAMTDHFMSEASVILTAPHPGGHDISLTAPVLTLQ